MVEVNKFCDFFLLRRRSVTVEDRDFTQAYCQSTFSTAICPRLDGLRCSSELSEFQLPGHIISVVSPLIFSQQLFVESYQCFCEQCDQRIAECRLCNSDRKIDFIIVLGVCISYHSFIDIASKLSERDLLYCLNLYPYFLRTQRSRVLKYRINLVQALFAKLCYFSQLYNIKRKNFVEISNFLYIVVIRIR